MTTAKLSHAVSHPLPHPTELLSRRGLSSAAWRAVTPSPRPRPPTATAPAAAPYDAESAAPPRLPAQPIVARIIHATALLLGTGVLTRGALWLLACVPWR